MANSRTDNLRKEMLRRELATRQQASTQAADMPFSAAAHRAPQIGDNFLQNADQNDFGVMSHPITNLIKGAHAVQNFSGGLMGGAQHLGATLGQAIEYPTHAAYQKITGNKVPHYNVRELFGLEGDQPVDLNKTISHDPNSFMSTIGKYSPAIAAGGASLPSQMAANGLWGAIQANPGQENAMGILPNGRIGGALNDAALAGVGGAALKYGPQAVVSGIKSIGKGLNYINPNKDAAAFLKSLGSGTKEENVQALAKDIDDAYQSKLQDALSHKRPVFQQEGKSNIYKTPESALPEGNLDKVAYYIAPGEKYTTKQLSSLADEIKNYRKSGDFDEFTHNVSELFGADMNSAQIGNLEHALSISPKVDSNFLSLVEKNPDLITGKTKDLFDKFKRRPTLNNADDLQSQIGADMGTYSSRAEKTGLNKGEGYELEQLKELRDSLKNEMQSHLQRVNPDLAEQNKIFSDKYRSNVIPYQEEAATKTIANEPKYIKDQRAENPSLPYNVTSSQMKTAFAEPSRQAQQIAGDIGEKGRNRILYNLLANDTSPEAKGLANAILNANQSEGYSQYITPQMEDFATQLLQRSKWRGRAKIVGGGLAGVAGVAGAEELLRKLIHGKG